MYSHSKIHCWEIMQCSDSERCPARMYPDIPCWEIAEVLGASQSLLRVCHECIVYIIKAGEQILTDAELDEIYNYRELRRFVKTCPTYDNSYRYENKYLRPNKLPSCCIIG